MGRARLLAAGVAATALVLQGTEAFGQCGNLLKSLTFEGCVLGDGGLARELLGSLMSAEYDVLVVHFQRIPRVHTTHWLSTSHMPLR